MLDYEDIYRQFNTQPNDEQDISIADDTARSAEALEDFLKKYNDNESSREKSEKTNRRIAVASLIASAIAAIVGIVQLLLQLGLLS